MASAETWKWVITLQLGTAIPVISFAVRISQYVLPNAVEFLTDAGVQGWRLGGLFGAFVGSYSLGRAVGTPLWLWLASLCGRRAILQVCLLIQFFLTLCFGLASKLVLALSFRLGIGLFASGYALARPILMDVLSSDRDRVPAATVTSVSIHSGMYCFGLILGTVMVGDQELPYLEASLIDVILLLFSFVIISTDFPETDPKKPIKQKEEQTQRKPSVKKSPTKRDKNGKFAAFSNEEGQNSVDQKEEDEVPSYLEHYASPDFPQLSVLKGVFTTEQEAHQAIGLEGDLTLDSGYREPDGHPTPDPIIKRTHISFVDEDLKETAPKRETIDDPFHSKGKVGSLRTASYCRNLAVYCLLVYVTTCIEFGLLFFLATFEGGLRARILGIVLSASSGMAAVLQTLVATWCVERWPWNRVGVAAIGLGTVVTIGIPFVRGLENEVWVSTALILLLSLRDISLRQSLTLCVLRLSDCVTTPTRASALMVSDWLGSLLRSLGILTGPVFVAWVGQFPGSATVVSAAAGASLVLAGLVLMARSSQFESLQKAPYRV